MKITKLLLLSALLTACSTSSEEPSDVTREGEVTEAVSPVAADWKASANERADKVRTDDPERFLAVNGLQPIKTRKGTPRFVGQAVRDPAAADVLLGRLAAGEEDPMIRAALVEALPRTGGDYGAELVAMLADETDADVRVVMVAALERADAASAHAGLVSALGDDDPIVRAEAARVASMRTDGTALAGELQLALEDETPQVRAAAARTIGVLQVADARDTLVSGLTDSDAAVRLQSLRAIGRIDPAYAASLPQLATLRADADARVANVADRLAQ